MLERLRARLSDALGAFLTRPWSCKVFGHEWALKQADVDAELPGSLRPFCGVCGRRMTFAELLDEIRREKRESQS